MNTFLKSKNYSLLFSNSLALTKKRNNSYFKSVNFKNFCTSSQLNSYSSPTTFDFQLFLPNLQKLPVTIEGNKTLSDFEAEVKKGDKFRTVEFRSWDHSVISKNNFISDVFKNRDPVFIRVSNMEWQLLNSSLFDTNTTEKFKIKEDFAHNAQDEIKAIKENLKRLDRSEKLNEKDFEDLAVSIYRIKFFNSGLKEVNEFKNSKLSNLYKNLEEVFEDFYQLKSEYVKLYKIKEKLINKSEFRTKALFLLAGVIFIFELLFIYWGTFVRFSWDIVEPITYLIGCANLVLILLLKRKMGNLSPKEYYINRFFNRMVRKGKFNQKQLEELEIRIKEMEKVLNK